MAMLCLEQVLDYLRATGVIAKAGVFNHWSDGPFSYRSRLAVSWFSVCVAQQYGVSTGCEFGIENHLKGDIGRYFSELDATTASVAQTALLSELPHVVVVLKEGAIRKVMPLSKRRSTSFCFAKDCEGCMARSAPNDPSEAFARPDPISPLHGVRHQGQTEMRGHDILRSLSGRQLGPVHHLQGAWLVRPAVEQRENIAWSSCLRSGPSR